MNTFIHSPVSPLLVDIASYNQYTRQQHIREQIITLSSARGATCQAQLGLVFKHPCQVAFV